MATTNLNVRSGVSATAIFTPRELKQYKRWQNLHTTLRPDEQGYLPSADDYEDFQQWSRKQDSGYFSDIFEDVAEHIKPPSADEPPAAILCRHLLHPAIFGQLRKRCPVCTMDMHIGYMRALEKALKEAGGRAPRAAMQATTEYQESLYAAFVIGKLETLRCLSELEQMAEQEEKWHAEHSNWENTEVRTASQALDLYWSEVFAVPHARPQLSKNTKAITFASDTEFEERRPQHYFHRKSSRYTPGKYAPQNQVAEEDEEELVSEDSEDYSRAPIMLEQGPSEAGVNVINLYDAVQTIGVLTDALRWSEAGVRKAEAVQVGSYESSRLELSDDDDDDDDSDWEMEDDETDQSYIYFEAEEDCSFVVFGD
ncbi:hypothetical protein E8E13_004400 [Curvularia kusanoi]|uniref:Uncharacterized protein n=1 Tax=Curvularia kusanoi TaxID=90978 RepID=A0A9P4TIA5_CURKU|nr:hypothetical protein E8E13_004400 [Curvularia kusanoi]